MKNDYPEKELMEKRIEMLAQDLAGIRAGRANPGVLSKLNVDYYGTPTPIQQIASVSVPDARTLAIQPWDVSALKLIEKAIQVSDLGINPQNDGKVIRLVFPQLTEERRHDLIKQCGKYAEESKVTVRAIRRDALEKYKQQKKKAEITEDDLKNIEKDMQDMTDKFCKEIDEVLARKEKELAEI